MTLLEGITYMHEHVTIDLSGAKGTDDTNLDCFDETVQEFIRLYEKGVRNVVDATVIGMGANPAYAQKVSELSGINVILGTGFYTQRFLPEFALSASAESLATFMTGEIREGIAGTSLKAGYIGEIGCSKDGFTPAEKKVFEAAVIAYKETGRPIYTHCTLGTFGHEQVAFFKGQGMDLSKVVIGHADLCGSSDYVLRMAEQGAYVGFDTIGKENYLPDATRVEMLKVLEAAGLIDRVMFSMDITRKSNMAHMGGIGYSYLLDVFVPSLQASGISDGSIQKILVKNPQAYFGGAA